MINIREAARRIEKAFKRRNHLKDITFFEVKDLYNQAYEQKAAARNALRQFRKIEARAREMDAAYRAQLRPIKRAA